MVADSKGTTLTLPSDREIVITRIFDAPRDLVFKVWTQPEHLKRWFGPRSLTMTVCEVDLRPGGAYRLVLRAADGEEYGFSGVYREIVPPARLVFTDGFEGMPGHEAVVTVTFDEHDGATKITSTSLYQSAEDRDGHIKSGMEEGMRESLDRVAELLAKL